MDFKVSKCRGRIILLPNLASGCTCKRQSFCDAASHDSLPIYLCNLNGSMNVVKASVDDFLNNVPDELRVNSYATYSRAPNNSIATQVNYCVPC